jgi:hypothetical protein
MLSGQEERAFVEIAEQMTADDPRFVASMRRLQARRRRRGHDVVVVIAAASAVLCVLLSLPAAAFAAGTLAYATHRLRPRPTRRPVARRPARRRRRGPR